MTEGTSYLMSTRAHSQSKTSGTSNSPPEKDNVALTLEKNMLQRATNILTWVHDEYTENHSTHYSIHVRTCVVPRLTLHRRNLTLNSKVGYH